MKKTFLVLSVCSLAACTKTTDYSYLNTDRRDMVVRISERYNNSPLTWVPFKVIRDTLDRNTRASDYANIPVDTIPKDWEKAWCSIDKIDSSFKIEIRKYKIK